MLLNRPVATFESSQVLHCLSLLLFLIGTTCAHAATPDAVVIIYAKFPGYNTTELGTGTFVDHDGLILTADHVIHHLTLSPPVTYMSNSVPHPQQPTQITVYSSFLNAHFDVDLSHSENVIGGQLGPQQWIDVAFIRVSLNDTQRAQIEPLALSQSAPAQGESLDAYGPLCTTSDPRCYQPGVTRTVLNNNPAASRDYQVRDSITPGYSGGPLVNTSGNIVALASWGDVITSTQTVVRASYIPAPYILTFFKTLPPSAVFAGPDACTRVHTMPYLTPLDWQEISARWNSQASLQAADQCACCCESLDKTRSAVGAPLNASCAPPFCAERRFYAIANEIAVNLQTKVVTADTAAAYLNLKTTFSEIDLSSATDEKKEQLYTQLGSTLAQIATSDQTRDSPDFADARKDAIVALNASQQIKETPQNYFAMAELFRSGGDSTRAAAATLLGTVADIPSSTLTSQFKINPQILRNNIESGIPGQANEKAKAKKATKAKTKG